MVTTYSIRSFADLIEIGTTMGKNWFRGHSKKYETLTPGLFREDYTYDFFQATRPQYEIELMVLFKRYSHSLLLDLPDHSDHITWLFWMQHYGIPTRLLDWTENILTAAFFAVTGNPKEDAEIWTIFPQQLNNTSKFGGIPTSEHSFIKYLSGKPYHNNPEKLLEELEIKEEPKLPMAFVAPYIFPRMSSQQSVFTIHTGMDDEFAIENILKDEKYITRYIIPVSLKLDFEKRLSYLGFNYRTLFPDLDGLANFFKRDSRDLGWGQPDPPSFDKK